MDEKLQKIADDFLARMSQKLPAEKPVKSFVVAMIGLPGSGRTTVARKLVEELAGGILLQSNSVRYLLSEAGMGWGENVRQVLKDVGHKLLADGYGVVFDGNAADSEDRNNIEELAKPNKTPIWYIRIIIDSEIAKARERAKYDDSNWVSSFDDFRVNTTGTMLKNIDDRTELHRNLKSSDIPNLMGEIDNNGTLDDLQNQVEQIIIKIKES